jgi:hypothetical protein
MTAFAVTDVSGSSSYVTIGGTGVSNIGGSATSTTQAMVSTPTSITGAQQVWTTNYAGLTAPGGVLTVNTANNALTSGLAIPGAATSGGAGSAFLTATAFKGVVSASLAGAGQSQSVTPTSSGAVQVNTHDSHVTLSLTTPVTNTLLGNFTFTTSANAI